MTYINPRLKHVKKIKEILTNFASDPYCKGEYLTLIDIQCNLLLETKKAKKRKKCEHSEIIGQFNATTIFDRECASCHKKLPDVKYEQSPAMKFMLKDINTPDPKEENEEKVCNCRGNGNANNVNLPCSSCGGVNPMKFTPSRSEELEKIIRNWKTAEFYVDDTCEDEEVSELSKAILTKFTLTPIK